MMPHVLTRSLDRSATIFLLVVAAVGILLPLSNLLLPEGSIFQVPTYLMALFGKYVCYALLALSIDLIWGYCGILSLGHGAFFALGGYAMGMYLMRQIGSRGVYGNPVLPDFMVFLNYSKLPWYWYGFDMFWFAAADGRCWCRACWRSASAGWRSAPASPASISRSSPRR